MSQQQQQNKLVNVGCGWENTSQQSGNQYFTLKFNQDIPAGSTLKAFWVSEKSSDKAPDLSIAGNESDGFVPEQQQQGQPQNNRGGNQQQRGNGGQQRNQQQSNRGGGGYQGNRGGNGGQQQGNRGGNGASRNQQRPQSTQNDFQDDLGSEEAPF